MDYFKHPGFDFVTLLEKFFASAGFEWIARQWALQAGKALGMPERRLATGPPVMAQASEWRRGKKLKLRDSQTSTCVTL